MLKSKKKPTAAGFEPARAMHIQLAAVRLNHSAKPSFLISLEIGCVFIVYIGRPESSWSAAWILRRPGTVLGDSARGAPAPILALADMRH